MMTREEYEAKREARYNRLLTAAARAEREGNALVGQAREMASAIPFGQPILVGHSSEGRDRRYRNRIEGKFRRGYDLHQRAGELRSRVEAAQRNHAIFSDDPDAVEKIADRVARLEERQRLMTAANKLVRKGDRDGLLGLGFSEHRVDELFTPDFMGRLGFADYLTANNSANIRRLKERAKTLERQRQDETTEVEIGDVRIVDNTDDNRVQIFFPGKPDAAIRNALKQNGFHWSPAVGAWQRQRSNGAMYHARRIVEGGK